MLFRAFATAYSNKFQGWIIDEEERLWAIVVADTETEVASQLGIGASDKPWQLRATSMYGTWELTPLQVVEWPEPLVIVNNLPVIDRPLVYSPSTSMPLQVYMDAETYREIYDWTWIYNPWTGDPRSRTEIANDPYGEFL